MLNRFSLRTKLLALTLSMSVMAGGAGYLNFTCIQEMRKNSDHIEHVNLPKTEHLGDLFATYRRVRILLRTLGLPGLSAAEAAKTVDDVKDTIATYEKQETQYRELGFVDGEKPLYDAIEQEWDNFKQVGQQVLAFHASGKSEDRAKMIEIFLTTCPERAKAYTTAVEKLRQFQRAETHAWVQEGEKDANFAIRWGLIIVTLNIVGSLLLGVFFSRWLSNTLRRVAQSLAANSDEVRSASSQISEASQNLSSSSTEQAAALQETVASLEEVSAMIAKNADNASTSQDVAKTSNDAAVRGRTAVEDMIQSIGEINSSNGEIMAQIEHSNREISGIVKVIAEIGAKTKVINDIVFQTKLLSFNASVEAARAGDHGKGFAVVAEEVGNLAQMSGNAAKEISDMLAESMQKVENIVRDTSAKVGTLVVNGRSKVEQGMSTANRCGDVLKEIVDNVGQLNRLIIEISAASKEQSQGVQEINKAMTQLDQTTQANTTTSQNTASSAVQLSTGAETLREMVRTLEGIVNGGGAAASASAAVPATSATAPKAKVIPFPAPAENVSAPNAEDPRFSEL